METAFETTLWKGQVVELKKALRNPWLHVFIVQHIFNNPNVGLGIGEMNVQPRFLSFTDRDTPAREVTRVLAIIWNILNENGWSDTK